MFDTSHGTLHGTVDQARERAREADRRELASITAQEARLAQRRMVIVRRADDRGDWRDRDGRVITANQPHAPPR
jgi:hypothetical protein